MPDTKVKVRTLISIIFMCLNFSIIRTLTLEQEISSISKRSGSKFDTGIDDTFQAPNDDTFQAANDDTFQAANDGIFKAANDDIFQAPIKNTFQSPIDTFHAPNAFTEESTSNPNSTPDAKVPCIEIFTSIFIKAVYSSEILSYLFNLVDTTPSALSKFLYDDAIDILLNSNIPDPEIIATSLTQPITEHFDQLYLSLVVQVYGSAMAKFLLAEGVLNEWNAASLALAYAEEMRKEAILSVVTGNPESKFKALSDGYKNFLKSFGLFVPEKYAGIASGFGKETKLVGNQFGKGASDI